MRRLAGAAALAFAIACGGKEAPAPPDAGAFDAGIDAPVAKAPRSCLEVRDCVQLCKDAACAQACVTSAPMVAQDKYRAAADCSRGACAEADMDCRCSAECIFPGACTAEIEECTDGLQDRFCDLCF